MPESGGPGSHIAAYKSNEEIANMAHDAMSRMGVPMHYQFIAKLVANDMDKELDQLVRTPETISFEAKVLRALNTHPMWFKRIKPGVYIRGRQLGW